jgi:signal transduction histidine kinase
VALISTVLFLYQKKRIAFIKNFEAAKLDYERNLLRTQLEIQEHTFQNIAREIHDNISLSLTLAKLNLNTLVVNERSAPTDSIQNSVGLISNAIRDLSNISKSLNSEVISSYGLITALQVEIDKVRRCGKHEIRFEVCGEPVYMDPQKELVLFRITQEALNNILKHANATAITLKLHYNKGYIDLKIADNGVGFDAVNSMQNENHIMKAGLTNMRSRANLIQGTCLIESTLANGTTISVSAPI